MAIIQTNLEIVLENSNQTVESQMQWLKNIEAENKRMGRLVEDLLTLSRSDTNEQTIDKKVFMLDESAKNVLAALSPIIHEKNINLQTNIDSDIAFYGDELRLKQLMVIFLENAACYTMESGNIKLSLQNTADKKIRLAVSDSGIGIEQHNLAKIFDRFYREDNSRQYHSDGSGLGLSIAKWIVDEHLGIIEVQSVKDQGTEFVVILPINL